MHPGYRQTQIVRQVNERNEVKVPTSITVANNLLRDSLVTPADC